LAVLFMMLSFSSLEFHDNFNLMFI